MITTSRFKNAALAIAALSFVAAPVVAAPVAATQDDSPQKSKITAGKVMAVVGTAAILALGVRYLQHSYNTDGNTIERLTGGAKGLMKDSNDVSNAVTTHFNSFWKWVTELFPKKTEEVTAPDADSTGTPEATTPEVPEEARTLEASQSSEVVATSAVEPTPAAPTPEATSAQETANISSGEEEVSQVTS